MDSKIQVNLFTKQKQTHRHRKKTYGDFPGDPVLKSLPADAGDTDSIPGPGESHTPRGSWTLEPQLLSPCPTGLMGAQSLGSTTTEVITMGSPRTAIKRSPHLPQLEKAHTQQGRPSTAINKLKKQTNLWLPKGKEERGLGIHTHCYTWNRQTRSYFITCTCALSVACKASLSMELSRQNTEAGCHFFLQGIFPTQGSNPHLLQWQAYSLPLCTWEALLYSEHRELYSVSCINL